jgi:hypothetical protein
MQSNRMCEMRHEFHATRLYGMSIKAKRSRDMSEPLCKEHGVKKTCFGVESDPEAKWHCAVCLAFQIEQLTEKVERLREALEFYADPETWDIDDWGIKAVNSAEYADSGMRAREALHLLDIGK